MADLNTVFLFCALYSGVVMSTLWVTVAHKARQGQLVKQEAKPMQQGYQRIS
jgi:hypothetical protein